MNIAAKNVVAKLSVAFIAAAMLLTLAAPAKAATVEELQAQIAALMAQISSLSGGSSAPAAGCTFTGALTIGSQGAEVTCLQNYLISNGFGISAGATGYFGSQTAAAVAAWQSANGVMPAAGYFGPVSQAKYNALVAAGPSTPGSDDSDDGDDNGDLSGEGALSAFEVDDDESSVMEGEEGVSVMVLTLEAEDGDVEVDRLSFTIADPGTANEENDPWDVFEEITLLVDGDEIASFDASDEDEYLDEDEGTFRFTDLELIVREDEEVEVTVAVSVNSSVDDAGAGATADWSLQATNVRYFDADGVATSEGESVWSEMATVVAFDIDEAGADDGARIEGNSSNPDASTILVDEDDRDSDEVVVHIFDIEVDRDSSDLEVGDAFVDVTITNASTTDIAGQEDVIDSIYMTIDGETVEGEATTDGDDDEDTDIDTSTTVRYVFEFDGDVVLEGDEEYEVEISMVFKGQDGNYGNGVTVATNVDGSLWEVEGEDDVELDGSDSSETHTLATVIPVISDTSFDVDRNEAGDAGTISFMFTLEADGDEDVELDIDDIDYTVTGTDTSIADAALSLLSGDADEDEETEGLWTIADGDEATFVLDVTFTTVNSADNGTYRVTVNSIEGVEIDETSTGLNLTNSTSE